jgi:chemotaxis protein CheD
MGELTVSSTPEDELLTIGLGSCIGVAVVDRARNVAGMAHVMLPDAAAIPDAPAGKFADLAIPALIAESERLGARRVRLEAVLVGGAQMFDVGVGSALDIGARNAAAVHAALAQARIPVRAAETGGRRGRTMRLRVGAMSVTVKEAGGREVELWSGSPATRRTAEAIHR